MSQKQAGETATWSFHKHEKLTMEMSSAPNAIQLFKEEGKKKPFQTRPITSRVKGGKKQEGKREGGGPESLHSSIYNHSGSEQPHSKCQKALFKTPHLKLNVVFSS